MICEKKTILLGEGRNPRSEQGLPPFPYNPFPLYLEAPLLVLALLRSAAPKNPPVQQILSKYFN